MSARRSHLIPRFSTRSASILVGTGILLLAFGFYTFVVQEPNPKAEYSRWLAEMTSPALPGKLERRLQNDGECSAPETGIPRYTEWGGLGFIDETDAVKARA